MMASDDDTLKRARILLERGQSEPALRLLEDHLAGNDIEDEILALALQTRLEGAPLATRTSTPLTLCMIVRDEERGLARCLRSVRDLVGELIVVDTGSADRSMEVAGAFGAHVYGFPWNGDFSEARNAALDAASESWVLCLDADEVLSPRDHETLRKCLAPGPPLRAYSLVTRNYVHRPDVVGWHRNDGVYAEEAGTGWIPSPKVRLFPRHPEIRFNGVVHELVEPSLRRLNMEIAACGAVIHHYGKLDEDRARQKAEEYRRLGMAKLEETGWSDLKAVYELAVQNQELGHHREAVGLWQRCVEHTPDNAHAFLGLGASLAELHDYQAAEGHLRQACLLNPDLHEARIKLALTLLALGRGEESAALMEHLRQKQQANPFVLATLAAANFALGDTSRGQELLIRLREEKVAGEGFFRTLSLELAEAGQQDYADRIAASLIR